MIKADLIVSLVIGIVSASGMWTLILNYMNRKDIRVKLVRGLAHDRIIYLGRSYINRGWVTVDEYENLNDYLYIPYKEAGGNGTAELVMKEVAKLKMLDVPPIIPEIDPPMCSNCVNFKNKEERRQYETRQ